MARDRRWKRMASIDFVVIIDLWICKCDYIHFLCPWLKMFWHNWASHNGFLHWTYNQGSGKLGWLLETSTNPLWWPNLGYLIRLSCLSTWQLPLVPSLQPWRRFLDHTWISFWRFFVDDLIIHNLSWEEHLKHL
jgi:hypothetical protein